MVLSSKQRQQKINLKQIFYIKMNNFKRLSDNQIVAIYYKEVNKNKGVYSFIRRLRNALIVI